MLWDGEVDEDEASEFMSRMSNGGDNKGGTSEEQK
jgi:hypothetical protein